MRVVWTVPALNRLDEIQTYIAEKSPAAAYRVVRRIYSRTEQTLSANPFAGRRGRREPTREFVLSDLPYIVVYRVGEQVDVLDVVHTARDWPESFGDG